MCSIFFLFHPYASSPLKKKVKRNFTFLSTCLPSSLSSLGLPRVSSSPLLLFPVLLFSVPYTVSVKCARGSMSHVKELFYFIVYICIPGLIVLGLLNQHWDFAVLLSPHHCPTWVISSQMIPQNSHVNASLRWTQFYGGRAQCGWLCVAAYFFSLFPPHRKILTNQNLKKKVSTHCFQ